MASRKRKNSDSVDDDGGWFRLPQEKTEDERIGVRDEDDIISVQTGHFLTIFLRFVGPNNFPLRAVSGVEGRLIGSLI